ncbi:MAG: InlB B-repeat-containing protein [Candidatus Fimivivens sp.]
MFDKWSCKQGTSFDDRTVSQTTFVMPERDTTVVANYTEAPPEFYSIMVVNGTLATSNTTRAGLYAQAGQTITVIADEAPAGKVFDKWVSESNNITFADKTATQTTFTMPAENTTVTATYQDAPPEIYSVTVINGRSDKAHATVGTTVTITADTAESGQVFDKWACKQGTVFTDELAKKTTIVMPERNVTVRATYEEAPSETYSITVFNGKADKEFAAPGETVTIKADMAPSRQVFDKWESLEPITYVRNNAGTTEDGLVLANKNSVTTTFVMPTKAVTITATYTRRGSGGGGGGSSGRDDDDEAVYEDYYVITSSASSGGTISPMGEFFMEEGQDKSFTITPDNGYEISYVLVDGESVGVVTSYTFKGIMKNHKIEVVFSKVNPSTGVDINSDATCGRSHNGSHGRRLHGYAQHDMGRINSWHNRDRRRHH